MNQVDKSQHTGNTMLRYEAAGPPFPFLNPPRPFSEGYELITTFSIAFSTRVSQARLPHHQSHRPILPHFLRAVLCKGNPTKYQHGEEEGKVQARLAQGQV